MIMSRVRRLVLHFTLVLILLVPVLGTACPSKTGRTTVAGTEETLGNLNLYNIDPYTLDPATASEATSAQYIMQIFGGLVTLDDNLTPAPDIARGWDKDTTGTIYIFTLRTDVTFQDGRSVTAADFKYSWERACLPTTQSQTAMTYLGDIVGVKDMLAGRTKEIAGVKVIDDRTLRVTIDAPKPYFLYKLAYVTAFVVDRDNVAQGADWWRKPNGTGPFKLKEWADRQSLVLERNPNFYGEKAKLATVTFKLWAGVPMRLFETGEIDVTGVSISYIDMVTDEAGPYLNQMSILPELSFTYIGFNCTRPPFDDANIRRAFSLAIDKKKLASLIFKEMVAPTSGILPPGMPGYNDKLQGLDFDPAQARALIKASKYVDVSKLPPITLTTSGYGTSASGTLEAIVNEWRQNLGVEVKLRQLEPEFFFYNLMREKDEMFDIGWIADYPYPQDFLEVLFHSGVDNNWSEYSNAEIDSLLDKAGTVADNASALALYQEIEQKLVDDAACLPLWSGKNYLLVKPTVHNYKPSPMGFVRLNRVSVSP